MTTFPTRTIYLAGPITGLTHDEARYGWREEFASLLEVGGYDHISCNSPMRGKDFLKGFGVLSSGSGYPKNALCSEAGINTRDYNDVKLCHAMVACYLESNNVASLGTAAEHGFAHALQKPIITIGPEDEINVRHIMLKRMAGYRVDTLEEAAHIVALLLTPGL